MSPRPAGLRRSVGPKPPRPPASSGASAFAQLVRSFAADPRVTLPAPRRSKFGDNGLKVDGRIFAMSKRDRLVLKLPRSEVDAAVAAGRGERLSMGPGRVMKEWLVVRTDDGTWKKLAQMARSFVARAP